MSGDVEAAAGRHRRLEIDVCAENAGFLVQRTGNYFSSWRDDHGIALIDPLARVRIEAVTVGRIARQIFDAQDIAGAEDSAAAFTSDMLQRVDPPVAAIVGRGDMDIDALCVECIAGKGHVVLPTHQRANPPRRRVDDLEPTGVAKASDHALGVGGHRTAGVADPTAADSAICGLVTVVSTTPISSRPVSFLQFTNAAHEGIM